MMRRTTKPGGQGKKIIMVNYYDENKAQRWGRLEKGIEGSIIVRNAYNKKQKIPREKIIEEKEISEEEAQALNKI